TGFQAPGAALERPTVRVLGATLAYGVAAALALATLAPPLIARWLAAYAPSIPILRVLAGALVFRTLNATLSGILQGAGRFRLLNVIALGNLARAYARG